MFTQLHNARKTANMAKIRLTVDKQLAALQERRGERITIEQFAFETKLALGTVRKWYKGHVDRFDSITLLTLCEYFECQPGDLLQIVDE